VISHLVRQDLLLRLIAMLEELLNYVVAKDISHQLNGVWIELSEDLVLLIAIGSLELLLNETRAMLIATKFDNVIVDFLQHVSVVLQWSMESAPTLSSYLLLVLLLFLNSSSSGLRTACAWSWSLAGPLGICGPVRRLALGGIG